jgi:osmotically-inducible protein OsmY
MRRNLARLLACLGTAFLAGCSNPTMLADVVTTPAESRSFDDVTDDAGIKLKINQALLSSQYRDLFFDVSSVVYQGRVLLTGKVNNDIDKLRASNLVRDIAGVKDLFNEIQVNVPGGLVSSANDAFIETEIKVRAAGVRDVKAIDYRWTAVNGAVYLIGYARSDAEAQKMIDVVRNTKYVKQVVPHIWTQP